MNKMTIVILFTGLTFIFLLAVKLVQQQEDIEELKQEIKWQKDAINNHAFIFCRMKITDNNGRGVNVMSLGKLDWSKDSSIAESAAKEDKP